MSQHVRSKFSQSKASTGSAFRLPRKQLFAAGVLSVLLSPWAIQSALAATPYSVASSYDSKLVSDLIAAQLTSLTFRSLINDFLLSDLSIQSGGTGGANAYNGDELLAIATNDAQFYSTTTPRYYKYKYCNSNPTSYFIVGNLLVESGDLRPEAKSIWYGGDTVQPTPSVTFDLCSQPKVPFAFPAGFAAASTDANLIFVRQSFPVKSANTIPQNTQVPAYSTNNLVIVLTRTNAQTVVTVPYSEGGTAAYGQDYDGSSGNGIAVNANTITLPTVSGGYAPFGATMRVFFNPNNHPQKTLQWSLTAPSGYTFIVPAR